MSEQIPLLEPAPPKLGHKQAFVLSALREAGADGLHADEAGALYCESRGIHHRDQRCKWDGKAVQTLKALRAKGLVQYRSKSKRWQAIGVEDAVEEEAPEAWDGTGKVPYNVIPY